MGFDFSSSKKLSIEFREDFDIADIDNMAKEVFKNGDYQIEYTDEFKDGVMITLSSVTDEQVFELESKIKEKYSSFTKKTEDEQENQNAENNNAEDTTNQEDTSNETNNNDEQENADEEDIESGIIGVIDMPSINIYDVVKVYIKPIIITSGIVLVFLAIVFRKIGIFKSLIITLCLILGINALYVSTLAILRIPINEYIIAIGIFVYIMSLAIPTLYEKHLNSKLEVKEEK